ncbi:alcohol dehydrogenase [Methylomagnum ishizawai]|uniref:Alcohol dehydrogenase n=1 Tax=Methylomagnum ishizawai TaxID=1760988 RepID=A0A1Y6CVB5_9GAMM|nr:iron-containing alcohol dehydrogenase [Methylomagnum ishizawai]SMF94267.1 alcohol dehydrogenase [Methylomagnum ishizawai]
MAPFSLGRLPRIEFGAGSLARLPAIAARYGQRWLIVTGNRSFRESPQAGPWFAALQAQGCVWEGVTVAGEPSPELVDGAVKAWRGAGIEGVIGIGGGSVLDAAKAIAGLLRPGNSVMDHLEGVGPELPYAGPATPFLAVPTTAGTGSEATKNAVLSRHGPDGFKKSFRDDRLMAEYAIVDPDLLAGCPPELIAANGMDALTQLLEAYVSIRANPITDALALQGLRAAREGLLAWYAGGASAALGREKMALASLLSGICLAQAGLGSVHGLAQPLGSLFPIPHGVVCGTLVAAATRSNIEAILTRDPQNPALAKYAEVGRLFAGNVGLAEADALALLVETLEDWTRAMKLPTLSALGVAGADVPRIVAHSRGSSMKTNPIVLSDDEIAGIVRARLA